MNFSREINHLLLPNEVFFLLVEERVAQGELVRINVKGQSMTPFLIGGRDKVELIKPSADSLRKGRIVLAHLGENRYVLHRVVRISNGKVLLKGDGNLYGLEQCEVNQVVAEAIHFIRNKKKYNYKNCTWKLASWLWPDKAFLRRILLFLWRKIYLKHT
jgi:hypothetical protein